MNIIKRKKKKEKQKAPTVVKCIVRRFALLKTNNLDISTSRYTFLYYMIMPSQEFQFAGIIFL